MAEEAAMAEDATMDETSELDRLLDKRLLPRLREAAEIEQQVMVQYLYAAFSLKKFPDSTCTPAQFEFVRRWGAVLLSVARSEMEHLALVNGMLSAVAAEPFFERQNIPLQFSYYKGESLAHARDDKGTRPCDIPFVFERFNLPTIERFVCIESPSKKTLRQYKLPIPKYCFSCDEAQEGVKTETRKGARLLASPPPLYDSAASHIPEEETPARGVAAAPDSLRPGTIPHLYNQIERLFKRLNGMGNVFRGDPSRQVFVPVEYQVNIFPITDLSSTLSAIRLITEEGEGIDGPPDYQSHFMRFMTIRDELAKLLKKEKNPERFQPSLPLLLNPKLDDITNDFARDLFLLFNYTYATLLFLLTSLYTNYAPQASQSFPFFSSALQENAFGPMMTMLLRPMAEVLAYTDCGNGRNTTGPNYELSQDDRKRLGPDGREELANIEFFLSRFDEIVRRLDGLRQGGGLRKAAREKDDLPFLRRQLDFVYESAVAMTNNLRRIYQLGQLPQFVVSP